MKTVSSCRTPGTAGHARSRDPHVRGLDNGCDCCRAAGWVTRRQRAARAIPACPPRDGRRQHSPRSARTVAFMSNTVELSPSGEFTRPIRTRRAAKFLLPSKRSNGTSVGAPIDAIYTHGGLVDEQGAGETAQQWAVVHRCQRVLDIPVTDPPEARPSRTSSRIVRAPTAACSINDDAWSDRVEGIARVVGKAVAGPERRSTHHLQHRGPRRRRK
jgi:hypothetical protein